MQIGLQGLNGKESSKCGPRALLVSKIYPATDLGLDQCHGSESTVVHTQLRTLDLKCTHHSEQSFEHKSEAVAAADFTRRPRSPPGGGVDKSTVLSEYSKNTREISGKFVLNFRDPIMITSQGLMVRMRG